ncbi:MAG: ABC transporter permease [Rhodospirillaceae bacterium]|nr:ABC transporter permease [Rhodospirillaceae bacterium]
MDHALLTAYARRFGIFIAFLVLCMAASLWNDNFFSEGNLINVLRQSSINGILAIGMTFVILTKGIDLSVGSLVALAGVVSASFATISTQMMITDVFGLNIGAGPHWVGFALGLGLLAGLLAGAINGVLVAYFSVPAFVVTLGMLSAARGATQVFTDGMPVPALSPEYRWIGTGELFGLPSPVIILAAVFLVGWVALTRTRYGRYVYAVGGNEKSAKTSGINTRGIILSVYIISGVLAALGGMLLAARTGSALVQAGQAYELDAIAAVVIGGTSLAGGVGTLFGTLVGALIIGVVNNILQLEGVQAYYQLIIKGGIIVFAVLLDPSRRQGG